MYEKNRIKIYLKRSFFIIYHHLCLVNSLLLSNIHRNMTESTKSVAEISMLF